MQTKTALLLVSALVTTGIGSSARAATVDKQKFQGSQTATSFTSSTMITCADGSPGSVTASGFLSGADSISKETGTPKTTSNGIFVEVDSYFNSCTGVSLSGEGGITNGYTPPNKKLNSAGLQGSTTVQDFGTGATLPLTLDLVVQGTGPLTATKAHSKSRTVQGPGGTVTITIDHSANSNREGIPSGTITIDGVVLDATFFSTTLSTNDNMQITIEKN